MISGSLSPVTNRETFSFEIEFWDEEAEESIDLDDVTEIVVEVYRRDSRDGCSGSAELSATLSGGDVTEIEPGVVQVRFSTTDTRNLCAGTYDIGGTLTKDGETVQFLLGSLPILNGIVAR